MTTQPPDLKKLREYANGDIPMPWLWSRHTILALLDAHEASARDAEDLIAKWREKERQLRCGDDFNDGIAHGYDMCADALEETIAARHITQGD